MSCDYCDEKGKVEMDNNGPIVDCPVCELSEPKAELDRLVSCRRKNSTWRKILPR
jgi:hypothetical protein